MKKIIDRARVWTIKHLTKKLLKAMTKDDILVISRKEWFLNKRKLHPEEIDQMKAEAESFEHSALWEAVQRELAWRAQKDMFDNAKVIDDLMFGKAMLYNLDLIRTFIRNIGTL